MNNSIYRISLDIHDTSSQISLSVKKGDTARSIYITLTENGKPYKIAEGCSANFEAKKADGNFIHNACRIEGNTIIYDLTTQTTAAVGATECEIALFDKQGEKLTSPCFTMVVEDTVYNGEEIVSTPEADALKVITDEAKDLIADVEEKLANDYFKGEPGETPSLDGVIQFWQPNTEYEVGDVCYFEHIADEYTGYSAILECKTNHISCPYTDPLPDIGYWTVKPIQAKRSERDTWGNVIHETYATKEEVVGTLGTINEVLATLVEVE